MKRDRERIKFSGLGQWVINSFRAADRKVEIPILYFFMVFDKLSICYNNVNLNL